MINLVTLTKQNNPESAQINATIVHDLEEALNADLTEKQSAIAKGWFSPQINPSILTIVFKQIVKAKIPSARRHMPSKQHGWLPSANQTINLVVSCFMIHLSNCAMSFYFAVDIFGSSYLPVISS